VDDSVFARKNCQDVEASREIVAKPATAAPRSRNTTATTRHVLMTSPCLNGSIERRAHCSRHSGRIHGVFVGYQKTLWLLAKGARHFVQKPVKRILYEVIKYVMETTRNCHARLRRASHENGNYPTFHQRRGCCAGRDLHSPTDCDLEDEEGMPQGMFACTSKETSKEGSSSYRFSTAAR